MKIITVHELLGLIHDGNIPQRIIYDKRLWFWDEENTKYYTGNYDIVKKGFHFKELWEPVEIIDEK